MSADELAASMTAITELSSYLLDQLNRAASDPGDDLLGELARACADGRLDSSPRN